MATGQLNPPAPIVKGAKKIKSPWSLDEDKKLIVIDENDWNNRLKILKQKVDFYKYIKIFHEL